MLTRFDSNYANVRKMRVGSFKSFASIIAIYCCGVLLSGCTMPAPERIVYLKTGEVRVEKGDSLSSIASRYGVSPKDLAACNHLVHQQSLEGISILMLPNSSAATVQVPINQAKIEAGPVLLSDNDADIWSDEPDYGRADAPAGLRPDQSIQRDDDVDLDDLENVVMGSQANKKAKSSSPMNDDPVAKRQNQSPSHSKPVQFRRPASGKITEYFQRNARGAPAQGIKFKAPFGTSVRAVADGKVVISGKMQGDPSKVMVLVRHNDGWTSCYKALADSSVVNNTLVKQGDCLGTCQGPELIFELRNPQRVAVDPVKYLAP